MIKKVPAAVGSTKSKDEASPLEISGKSTILDAASTSVRAMRETTDRLVGTPDISIFWSWSSSSWIRKRCCLSNPSPWTIKISKGQTPRALPGTLLKSKVKNVCGAFFKTILSLGSKKQNTVIPFNAVHQVSRPTSRSPSSSISSKVFPERSFSSFKWNLSRSTWRTRRESLISAPNPRSRSLTLATWSQMRCLA